MLKCKNIGILINQTKFKNHVCMSLHAPYVHAHKHGHNFLRPALFKLFIKQGENIQQPVV